MSDEVFLDSNVLLYASSSAPADAWKRDVAESLILNHPFALSAQVLQEYIANALRKPALGITESNIDATLGLAALVRVQAITHEIVVSAVILRRRYQLSQWDATILAAAAELGCAIVYSEDMNDGQDYDGIRVVNPFKI
ncbi:MAG: PIN domain-containing protein [Verrucomicrobiales bacterium]|nr:PIN domain-containing protein [Verrucomicrobiales bacterium]